MARAGKRWRHHRRDANEKPIVDALVDVGAHVTKVSGKGAPDLLVRFRGQLWAFEVKSRKGHQTDAQEATNWPIVRDVPSALAAIGVQV